MKTKFYEGVKVRDALEIEEEIVKQKSIVIKKGFETEEGRRANDRAIWLEWALGVRSFK